eukprot:6205562-Pleurochrysis_carterae.AAC.2
MHVPPCAYVPALSCPRTASLSRVERRPRARAGRGALGALRRRRLPRRRQLCANVDARGRPGAPARQITRARHSPTVSVLLRPRPLAQKLFPFFPLFFIALRGTLRGLVLALSHRLLRSLSPSRSVSLPSPLSLLLHEPSEELEQTVSGRTLASVLPTSTHALCRSRARRRAPRS